MFKRTSSATSLQTIEQLYAIAKKNLDYIYIGNYGNVEVSNTYCSNCGAILVNRQGRKINVKEGKCGTCNEKIPIIF